MSLLYPESSFKTPTVPEVSLDSTSPSWSVPEIYHPEDSVLAYDSIADDSILVNMIKESATYREAYQLFSSDKSYGKPFLQELILIPTSITVRDSNFWDDFIESFGGTSGQDKAIIDAFNQAMDAIVALVRDYHTFINKLPVNQVEQQREAGINSSVTGEGVTSSDIPSNFTSAINQPSQPQSAYDNKALSDGVMSFVQFLSSVGSIANTGFTAASLMGMLNLAEREGYNKQEVHDMLMASQGVTNDSPYRVLGNDAAFRTLSKTARSVQNVAAAQASADESVLDSRIELPIGNDPENPSIYEVKSGKDWFVQASRAKVASMVYNSFIESLRSEASQRYASAVANLEGQYQVSNFGALINESNFNRDFYANRNGATEGSSQTSIAEDLAHLRNSERMIKGAEEWFASYRAELVNSWGEQLSQRPDLMPFFYKALLDFDMEDTFYHSSNLSMGLKYGTDALDSVGNFLSNISGLPFKKFGKFAKAVKGARVVSKSSK